METVNKIFNSNQDVIALIVSKCGLGALNDTNVFAVFVAAHLKLVETTPDEMKDIDATMQTLVNTGFADGSMGCTMSEDDLMEML